MGKLEEVRKKAALKTGGIHFMPDKSNEDDLKDIEKQFDEACELYGRMKKKGFKDNDWEKKMGDVLSPLKQACNNCEMCELGKNDQHVFSNMNYSKWVVVGQSPGKNDPFVGRSSKKFDEILESNGIDRSYFYITNVVKCFIENIQLHGDHIKKCEPFLKMELQILKPNLVITLNAIAFYVLCPKMEFTPGKIVESKKFGVKVYPLDIKSDGFVNDLSMLCKLIKKF